MNKEKEKIAIIIGAGPAGLTAAYELLKKNTNIKPIIFELSKDIGGISKTVNYNGNRMDMGGHRFFSKSDKVMDWWKKILPIENTNGDEKKITIDYQNKNILKNEISVHNNDNVMLIRKRLSRIYFLRKFFDYPIKLNVNTINNLGMVRMIKISFSYLKSKVRPINKEKTLEEFFIKRFGKELYLTFFKSYTEKVWGIPCSEISSEWGAQRIKGLSLTKSLVHFLKSFFVENQFSNQKNTETSLIENFLYPKFGPGQMWEETAKIIESKGGEIHLLCTVKELQLIENKILSIKIENPSTNKFEIIKGDYFFSTMPIKELIGSLIGKVPENVKEIASKLPYRDFITVGLLLNKLNTKADGDGIFPDNWIYIQEPEVKIGRLQIFNNWSQYLVKDQKTVWLGLEYFCNEGDELWNKNDQDFISFAVDELTKIGIIEKKDIIDSTIVRVKKAYPAYFGAYKDFSKIRNFTDKIENLFLIGRNGMHKYNNQDHSMLTAMQAVDNIINNVKSKDNIWDINAEQEYHETK